MLIHPDSTCFITVSSHWFILFHADSTCFITVSSLFHHCFTSGNEPNTFKNNLDTTGDNVIDLQLSSRPRSPDLPLSTGIIRPALNASGTKECDIHNEKSSLIWLIEIINLMWRIIQSNYHGISRPAEFNVVSGIIVLNYHRISSCLHQRNIVEVINKWPGFHTFYFENRLYHWRRFCHAVVVISSVFSIGATGAIPPCPNIIVLHWSLAKFWRKNYLFAILWTISVIDRH